MDHLKPLRLPIELAAIVFLSACTSTMIGETETIVPISTEIAIPTVQRTSTPTHSPTITPTDNPTNTPEPTNTPSPTPGPIKPVLLEFGATGGDGGTSYDAFFGRDMPAIILYTDGQMLISGEQYGVRDWYLQKILSVQEMCILLKQIRATGFFDVKGTGQAYPDDPIYQTSEYFGDGAGGYFLQVNGKPSKWVFIYGRAVDNLVPAVKAAYELIGNYHPNETQPFVPDRLVLRVERQPGEDWFRPTPPPPQPWPSEFPPLADLLKDQGEHRGIMLQGRVATGILQLLHWPGGNLFVENGEEYFVVGRPLLPHETSDYFSILPWADSSFDLPFGCEG